MWALCNTVIIIRKFVVLIIFFIDLLFLVSSEMYHNFKEKISKTGSFNDSTTMGNILLFDFD